MIKTLEKRRWLSLTLLILIAIEIFWFSTIQGAPGTGSVLKVATIYHFVVFFLFAFFLFTTIKGKYKIKPKHIIITLIVSIAYAISDEVHQMYVPTRTATIYDLLINSMGILAAVLIYIYIERKKISKKID